MLIQQKYCLFRLPLAAVHNLMRMLPIVKHVQDLRNGGASMKRQLMTLLPSATSTPVREEQIKMG